MTDSHRITRYIAEHPRCSRADVIAWATKEGISAGCVRTSLCRLRQAGRMKPFDLELTEAGMYFLARQDYKSTRRRWDKAKWVWHRLYKATVARKPIPYDTLVRHAWTLAGITADDLNFLLDHLEEEGGLRREREGLVVQITGERLPKVELGEIQPRRHRYGDAEPQQAQTPPEPKEGPFRVLTDLDNAKTPHLVTGGGRTFRLSSSAAARLAGQLQESINRVESYR